MSGVPTLEKFRQRLERGVNDYRIKGGRLHEIVQGQFAELGTFCEAMAATARRMLRSDCRVDREVMPYSLDTDSFMVRHRFYRDDAHTDIDVTFSGAHMTFNGQQHSLSDYFAVQELIADEVLSFYLPR